jgi:Cytochrome c554 and c-prime
MIEFSARGTDRIVTPVSTVRGLTLRFAGNISAFGRPANEGTCPVATEPDLPSRAEPAIRAGHYRKLMFPTRLKHGSHATMKAACAVLCLTLSAPPLAAAAAPLIPDDSACAACHRTEATRYRATPMADALEKVNGCTILKQHPDLSFQEGPYHSRIARQGDRSILTVTHGSETLTIPLLWAFGHGKAGQTYVFEYDGAMYESRVSFYNALGALDLTMGALGSSPHSIVEAAGRRMDDIGARDCFGCHSNGGVTEKKLHLESLVPGVGCQSCHGPAEKHTEAVRVGDPVAAELPHLGALSAGDLADLCGRCHRTWSQIALNGPRGVNNVRFQPYRLVNSKCFDPEDRRIRCAACHDPHGEVETNLATYDAKCTACHAAALHTKVCRVAKANCVGCHMPKLDLPGAHAQFTDHQIRIVRAGDPYPN